MFQNDKIALIKEGRFSPVFFVYDYLLFIFVA